MVYGKAKSGFMLVGVMIASLVMLVVMASVTKLIQSSYHANRTIRQISDFDTVKVNIKYLISSEARCAEAFRQGKNPATFRSGAGSITAIDSITSGGSGPLVSVGDRYSTGMAIQDIALTDTGAVPESVTKAINGSVGNYKKYVVKLSVTAAGEDAARTQNLDPSPVFEILVNDVNKIVSCQLNPQANNSELCFGLGGVWDANIQRCALPQQERVLNKNCADGMYLTGFDLGGGPLCKSLPVPQIISQPVESKPDFSKCQVCSTCYTDYRSSETVRKCASFNGGVVSGSAPSYAGCTLSVTCEN